ncbi:hypothetical protein J437_LFUL005004 [Ladona fulva]|uniref:Uncharacterized protein n=1 Tax=Ladona fulva TaxID=123851 RepID=A0A8K0NUX2_LADFU|nr:hypothetical protein J437_LFUL005004 [Ladona fulva]
MYYCESFILDVLAQSDSDDEYIPSSESDTEEENISGHVASTSSAIVRQTPTTRSRFSSSPSSESSSDNDSDFNTEATKEPEERVWSNERKKIKRHAFVGRASGCMVSFQEESSFLEYFLVFFPPQIMARISEETNKYYVSQTKTEQKTAKSRVHKWVETSPDDFA